MKNPEELQNKKIFILGYGMENRALVDFLIKKKINCEITICDANNVKTRFIASQKITWRLGKNYDRGLDEFDIISRIAGYPLSKLPHPSPLLNRRGGKKGKRPIISSPVKLFFDFCPSKNIIGITGTKGKGTTASLIYAILKKAGKRVFLGGNIGVPMFSFMDKIKKNDWVILELSSFQLEDMKVSPKIAVITNFYQEHLKPVDPVNPNFHKTLADYWKAKANIFKHQDKGDKLIINKNLKSRIKNYQLKGKVIYFSKSDLESRLLGEHNKENIAAAVAVAKTLGLKEKAIAKAVAGFKGLPHRLEFVKKVNGVSFYNDSFATTPENTIAALNSFSAPIILLAGGADKGSSFKELAKVIRKKVYPVRNLSLNRINSTGIISKSNSEAEQQDIISNGVKLVILFAGKATPRLKKELLKAGFLKEKIKPAGSMEKALTIARKNAKNKDIILLSPGCASFGLFKNYKERGQQFKNKIKK
ncbi:MAG: UDP-N-acetylmuramoyl-L-alanine--D-glutamate ligase [Patescibacteria group bacterium]|nr:UDP-N-acetylmuramoyl-L-alanine--D-glutamate ligase [Patescibacteria group bacterium]